MGHGQHCQLGSCTKFHHASLHLASDNEVHFVFKPNGIMCIFLYILWYYFLYCMQEKVDPFSLVADELSSIANRLRAMVSTEVYLFNAIKGSGVMRDNLICYEYRHRIYNIWIIHELLINAWK